MPCRSSVPTTASRRSARSGGLVGWLQTTNRIFVISCGCDTRRLVADDRPVLVQSIAQGNLDNMRFTRLVATLGLLGSALIFAPAAGATGVTNSGFYDHQIIEYEATFGTTSSPQAALQISKGEIVYHVVGPDGNPPAVQCTRLLAALPNDATSCNTLNFIPTEVGYTGGAWNLQIFHWKA